MTGRGRLGNELLEGCGAVERRDHLVGDGPDLPDLSRLYDSGDDAHDMALSGR